MFGDENAGRAMRPPPWWQRLHGRLMPDYNAKATAYWWAMVGLGGAAFAGSAAQVTALSGADLLQLAAGILLAMLMALFPMKIPRTNQAFSLGDVFIVLLRRMHGAAAGCVAAALEGLVSSWRSSKRWTTRLVGSTGAQPHGGRVQQLATGAHRDGGESVCLWTVFSVFGWVGAASAVAAALAALLFITPRLVGMGVMLTVLPVVGLM